MRVRSHSELEAADADLARPIRGTIPSWDPWPLQPEGAYFDVGLAGGAIDWIQRYCHLVKGPKAGQPFILDPYQAAIVASLWGFRLEDGRRRFRICFLYVGKKNAKTSLTAAIALLVMATDEEWSGELYSVASVQKQAGLVYDHMAGMIRLEPKLKKRFRVLGNKGGSVQKSIVDQATMSAFKCFSSDADSADGVNPSFVGVDELHRHRTPELMDVLIRSSRTRSQPLIMITTTADYARESACNSQRSYAMSVRENGGDLDKPGHDPHYLPAIWEADVKDDWRSPETWRKANPGLGTIKPYEAMEAGVREAESDPMKLTSFLRLDLNIVTDTDDSWVPADQWDACSGSESLEELRERMRGETCYAGMDLASKVDMSAVVLYFPSHGVALPWFWIPRETADRYQKQNPKRFLFSQWERGDYIARTDGGVTDYSFIRAKLLELRDEYDLREIGYDPYNAQETVAVLQEAGIKMVEMRQGPMTLGEATKQLQALWVSKKLVHAGHPVLRWNALNTALRIDPNANPMPCKKKSSGQIDGIVALVMALAGAIHTDVDVSLDDCYEEGTELYA